MKTRLLLLILLVLIISNIGFISHVYASQCISGIPLEDNYKTYDHIFSGIVTSINDDASPQVTLLVYQSWKGNVTAPMIVMPYVMDFPIGFQFFEGERYLVFAEDIEGRAYPLVTGCGPTKLLSKSNDTILQLQQLTNFTHPLSPCSSEIGCYVREPNICDTSECFSDETIKPKINYPGGMITELDKKVNEARQKLIDSNFVDRESEHNVVNEQNLNKAMQNLRQSFDDNVSFGSFNIKDVVVGYGVSAGSIIVDVKTEYYESENLEIIKENIQEITGDVHVKYASSEKITNDDICGTGSKLVDGMCQVIVTDNVNISNKGFIIFLITLIIVIPSSIGLVYWRKRK